MAFIPIGGSQFDSLSPIGNYAATGKSKTKDPNKSTLGGTGGYFTYDSPAAFPMSIGDGPTVGVGQSPVSGGSDGGYSLDPFDPSWGTGPNMINPGGSAPSPQPGVIGDTGGGVRASWFVDNNGDGIDDRDQGNPRAMPNAGGFFEDIPMTGNVPGLTPGSGYDQSLTPNDPGYDPTQDNNMRFWGQPTGMSNNEYRAGDLSIMPGEMPAFNPLAGSPSAMPGGPPPAGDVPGFTAGSGEAPRYSANPNAPNYNAQYAMDTVGGYGYSVDPNFRPAVLDNPALGKAYGVAGGVLDYMRNQGYNPLDIDDWQRWQRDTASPEDVAQYLDGYTAPGGAYRGPNAPTAADRTTGYDVLAGAMNGTGGVNNAVLDGYEALQGALNSRWDGVNRRRGDWDGVRRTESDGVNQPFWRRWRNG